MNNTQRKSAPCPERFCERISGCHCASVAGGLDDTRLAAHLLFIGRSGADHALVLLRCSALSFRPQASSTHAEKFAFGFSTFSRSTLASIPSIVSCGKRIFFCADFAFIAFVAMLPPVSGEGTPYQEKTLTCTPTINIVGPHHEVLITQVIAKPGSVGALTGPLTTSVTTDNGAAMKNSTTHPQGRNNYTWRFLAINRHDKKAKPCCLSVVAATEREARRILAPHFILSLAARLPIPEVCHA